MSNSETPKTDLLFKIITWSRFSSILETETIKTLTWNILVIPISIMAIALSIRLILIEKE